MLKCHSYGQDAYSNVLWEAYIGVSGQGGAPNGPSPLLKLNNSSYWCQANLSVYSHFIVWLY